jgi:hypothetical protein
MTQSLFGDAIQNSDSTYSAYSIHSNARKLDAESPGRTIACSSAEPSITHPASLGIENMSWNAEESLDSKNL